MKYIVKNTEPNELLDWKSKDKMYLRSQPKWNRLPTGIKDCLREKISEEQGHICCYCERELVVGEFHLEHLKPKDKNKYPQEQLAYENLLCSCQLELEEGEPRHCGNSKGSWYEENQIITPLDSGCEGRFKYLLDGQVLAIDDNDLAAKTTIFKMQLGEEKLIDLRKNVIESFTDENLSEEEVKLLIEDHLRDKSHNGGKFNEFYTTIKYLASVGDI